MRGGRATLRRYLVSTEHSNLGAWQVLEKTQNVEGWRSVKVTSCAILARLAHDAPKRTFTACVWPCLEEARVRRTGDSGTSARVVHPTFNSMYAVIETFASEPRHKHEPSGKGAPNTSREDGGVEVGSRSYASGEGGSRFPLCFFGTWRMEALVGGWRTAQLNWWKQRLVRRSLTTPHNFTLLMMRRTRC